MKRYTLLALTFLAGTAPAAAQTTAAPPPAASAPAVTAPATVDADPALWVVKDADTTIYLFGTVHVLKPGLSWFDEAVKAAFDKSGELVLEINQPDPATMRPMMMQMGVDPAGTPLSETLPDGKGAAYLAAMTGIGVPTVAAEHFRPWLAATILSVAPLGKLGYDANNGPEHVLTEAATAAGKKLGALETVQQQFGYLAGLSQPAQVQFLTSALDDLPKIGPMMDEMVTDWSKGDPDALAKLLNDDLTASPELKKTLLTDRNARWADWVQTRLKTPGTVFVAVGAGHLAGPDSVQADLSAKHVTVTRIAY